MPATDIAIQKKILGSGVTTPIISNEEMDDVMKIVKSLEESGLLIKGVSKAIKIEAKKQEGGFLSMLLGALGAILLGKKYIKNIKTNIYGIQANDSIMCGYFCIGFIGWFYAKR